MNSLVYLAFFSNGNFPGIDKKIDGTIAAAREMKVVASKQIFPCGFKGLIKAIKLITSSKDSLMIVRFYDWFFPLLLPFFIYRRLFVGSLIVDVPTPRAIFLKEYRESSKLVPYIFRSCWNYFSSFIIFLPFDRIVQYSEEGRWFSLFLRKKTVKVGNGIHIDKSLPISPSRKQHGKLNLIGVAQVSVWHGYDRLINAIKLVQHRDPDYKIKFHLVGEGAELSNLRRLVSDLNLEESVFFHGLLVGEELDRIFAEADIGVSSLGLYRIGLREASPLKTREYVARGLCVIAAGIDPDFMSDSRIRFEVSNDEEVESIASLLLKLKNVELLSNNEVRKFAEQYISLDAKVKYLLSLV